MDTEEQKLYRCSCCDLSKPVAAFGTRPARQAGKDRPVPYYCRPCATAAGRQNYQDNKERYKQKAALRNIQMRERLAQLKSGPCTDCNVQYPPFVMDWDHLDAASKLQNVSYLMRHRVRWEVILEEISKCELVCANCHRARTHARMTAAGQADPNDIN